MAVSKRLRFEVLRRDNHTCRYCGASAPDVKLTVDHVVPETLGGSDEPSNLVTACWPCNSGKSSIAPDAVVVEDVKQDAIRWKRAMEMARLGDLTERAERDERRAAFTKAWNTWGYGTGEQRKTLPLPVEWPDTIDAMYRGGLDEDDLRESVAVAMRRRNVDDRFRYFCGVSWNMLRSRQDVASVLAPLVDKIDALPPADPNDPWSF